MLTGAPVLCIWGVILDLTSIDFLIFITKTRKIHADRPTGFLAGRVRPSALECSCGLGRKEPGGARSERKVVLNAEHSHVRHTLDRVVVVVSKFTNWVAALLGKCSSRNEVIRRRSRCFEIQAFH